jgi:hypothetical protein
MIKTIITIPNWNEFSQITNDQAVQKINEWRLAGRYTGRDSRNVNDQQTLTVERWEWIDDAVANEYKSFILDLCSSNNYTNCQVDIITE